jgi:hypothetical protein
MIKKSHLWGSKLQYPALDVNTDWFGGKKCLKLNINGQFTSFNQEGLRKFAKEFNLLADAMDEIQGLT